LAALLTAFAARAQDKKAGHSSINIAISDPVSFKELLVAGASTDALVPYSAYGAARSATFNFNNATIGNMRHCTYTVRCEKGKITGIFLTVQEPASCEELETYANAHFGQPVQESLNKKDGELEAANYVFDAKGIKVKLSVVTGRYASLVMN
jgi:hypothetical protein